MRKNLGRLALAVGVPLLLLCVGEVALRCFFFRGATDHKLALLYYKGEVAKAVVQRLSRFMPDDQVSGLALNRRAWESSFSERGMAPPHHEPREGYWGWRLNPKARRVGLRWIERKISIPGLVDVDADGFQAAGSPDAEVRILILGGSVAFGASASTLENTYFSMLAEILARRVIDARVYVLAAGAWVSHDELLALVLKGVDKDPHIVVFFDGLNDLTNIDRDYGRRVTEYLANMAKAKAIAVNRGMDVVYVLQPVLPLKKEKTVLEERLLALSGNPEELLPWYDAMRRGLRDICDEHAHFLDCSSALSDETFTTFVDQWHFSDFGQELVAEAMADGLAQVIAVRAQRASASASPQ